MKKGIVISPGDFIGVDWLAKMTDLGLNTLGLHSGGGVSKEIVQEYGEFGTQAFREKMRACGLDWEYEAHASASLLPPSLHEEHPEFFAMRIIDAQRNPNADWCISNPDVAAILEENTAKLAAQLPSSTHRYYFWGGDSNYHYPCHCEKCREHSQCDLTLMAVNAMARGIRKFDPEGQMAYLAYLGCLDVPESVEPEENVFLEFAPYIRCYHHALADESCNVNRKFYKALKELASFFGASRTQVLEYWLDASLFSDYKKPCKCPFTTYEIMRRDIETYRKLGIQDFTTFGVYMDGDYFNRFGDALLESYVSALQ